MAERENSIANADGGVVSPVVKGVAWTPELVLLAARAAQLGLGPKAGDDAIPRDFACREHVSTRRMRLREVGYRDVGVLAELGEDDRVHATLVEPRARSLVEIVALVVGANQVYRDHPGLGLWRANTQGGDFIGLFSLVPIAGSDEVEIGARLPTQVWGRGYALEGSAALCSHAFSTVGLDHVVGVCHPDNRSVPHLFDRLGFRADGVVTYLGQRALRYVLDRTAWAGVMPRRKRSVSPELRDALGCG